MASPAHPEDRARRNRRVSALLVLFGGAMAALVGYGFGTLAGFGWWAVVPAVGIAGVSAGTSYFASDRIVLAATGAQLADPQAFRRYHNLVEGLCIAAGGVPKPRLYVVDSPAPNAFATGRDRDHAAVAVTTGLLEKLDRVELEGVIAHELSHVRNLDVRLMAVVTVVVGSIVLLADWTLRSFAHGGFMRDRRRSDGVLPVLAVVGVLAAIVAPLAARALHFAVSRQREYLADADGVLLTRYPPGLANALRKIAGDPARLSRSGAATAHLWLHDPLHASERRSRGGRWVHLFDTHPPIADRIARLEAM